MPQINVIDRCTKKVQEEPVYGGWALDFVYGDRLVSRLLGRPLLHLLLKTQLFSWFYGVWQKTNSSKKKIKPFIETFGVDASEFLDHPDSYRSFNDFFIRKLKREARPIAADSTAVIPADGRYRFINNLSTADGFLVKGESFTVDSLLRDAALAKRYEGGTMVMARLCPTDYHRFHFPCDNNPATPKLLNGSLYSVNPIATQRDIHIYTKNKRMLTLLKNTPFGEVAYIEVGATCVGTIQQTFTPNTPQNKGAEKGYFEFGASALILLFEPNSIQLHPDLLELSREFKEIRCLMGQPMGHL